VARPGGDSANSPSSSPSTSRRRPYWVPCWPPFAWIVFPTAPDEPTSVTPYGTKGRGRGRGRSQYCEGLDRDAVNDLASSGTRSELVAGHVQQRPSARCDHGDSVGGTRDCGPSARSEGRFTRPRVVLPAPAPAEASAEQDEQHDDEDDPTGGTHGSSYCVREPTSNCTGGVHRRQVRRLDFVWRCLRANGTTHNDVASSECHSGWPPALHMGPRASSAARITRSRRPRGAAPFRRTCRRHPGDRCRALA
jgi:hypothetical protein